MYQFLGCLTTMALCARPERVKMYQNILICETYSTTGITMCGSVNKRSKSKPVHHIESVNNVPPFWYTTVLKNVVVEVYLFEITQVAHLKTSYLHAANK